MPDPTRPDTTRPDTARLVSKPARLLALLDRLGEVLAARGDAVALLGLGSVGTDLQRLDEHSDADFFVIVDDGAAQARYLADLDWLEALGEIAFSFDNTDRGRKVLYTDDVFLEYAVFTPDELRTAAFTGARLVWRRPDAPDGIEVGAEPSRLTGGPAPTIGHQVGELLTNLYIGLHRDARGERLSAARFIQSYAVDRYLTILGLLRLGSGPQQDPFAVERGAERRFGAGLLPLADLVPGYLHNPSAAARLLECAEDLRQHGVDVDPAMARAVRDLLA